MRPIPILVLFLAMWSGQSAWSAASFQLDIGGERFDPVVSEPTYADNWSQTSEGPGLQLVQFSGPIRSEWLPWLRQIGLSPIQYIHPYSYVVYGDGVALSRASAAEYVRWSGAFLPAYKVQPEQRALDSGVRPVMMLVVRDAERSALAAVLADADAVINRQTPLDSQLELIQLSVAGDAFVSLAQQPAVYAIQAISQDAGPRGESSNQAVVGNYGAPPSNTIVPGYQAWLDSTGYDGNGVTVGIVDGGVRTTHVDLVDRMLPCTTAGLANTSCSSANDAHGTHVAGAVAGTAATGALLNGFLRGQGIAPGANVVQQRYPPLLGGGPGGMVVDGMLTIYHESALSGALLTNNSWGPTGTPQGYDIPTQQIDMIVRDANPDLVGAQPVLPVWSIMNGNGDRNTGPCQPSSLGSPDEAKNLFAVGSTKLLSGGNQIAAIFDVSANSAHGNACDGRRVPHIVAPGCSTDSTTSSNDSAHSSSFCGTSMASPIISGSVALFIEKYRDEQAGSTPSPALIKAAFTAVAQNLEGFRNADNGVMGHRPDRFQGYGRLDLDAVMNPPLAVQYVDQTTVFLASGENWTVSFEAEDPAQPMRVMLAWTDARGHGLGGSTPAWVNDLDLQVLADGDIYLGNAIGSDGWSDSAGGADERNNLEAVYLRDDQHAGQVTITVDASNIAADALDPFDPGDPAQDFALVCYNCRAATAGNSDVRVSLIDVATVLTAGDTHTVQAEVGNLGPDAATGVSLKLTLPPELGFVSGRLVSGDGTWTCSAGRLYVECLMVAGSLDVDAMANLEIDTIVSETAASGPVEIAVNVSAPSFSDPDASNNNRTTSLTLIGAVIHVDGFEE